MLSSWFVFLALSLVVGVEAGVELDVATEAVVVVVVVKTGDDLVQLDPFVFLLVVLMVWVWIGSHWML